MKKQIADVMIFFGCVCIVAGIAVYGQNYQQNKLGQEHCDLIVHEFQAQVLVEAEDDPLSPTVPQMVPVRNEMLMIQGDLYIGVLEYGDYTLPIYMDYSMQNLLSAPCAYAGSLSTNDLVIAGHNYQSHFWDLQYLSPGSTLKITNPNGKVYRYEVVVKETLHESQLTTLLDRAQWDLTLFTCSFPDSNNRIVLRCNRLF